MLGSQRKEAVMPRITTTIEIRRPQQETFAYLTDPRNALEWSTELVDVTYNGDLTEGTTGSDTRKMGGKTIVMPWTVSSYQRPDRIVFEYGRPFPATAEFSFRPTDDGTMVTCDTDLRPRGWWRLLAPLMVKEARKADQVQFPKVKEILEARRGSASNEERETA
jgi:uncharacterized protein YndB with AHSA1/START domain